MSIVDRFMSWIDGESSSPRPSFIELLEDRRLMSITLTASVGEGGVNRDSDVRQVQQRLRDLNFRASNGTLLVVDGDIGPRRIDNDTQLADAAILPPGCFQQGVGRWPPFRIVSIFRHCASALSGYWPESTAFGLPSEPNAHWVRSVTARSQAHRRQD